MTRAIRGFARGVDFWFLVLSGVIVLVFVYLALFPGTVAPYGPYEEVGPRMLPPGQSAPGWAILTSEAGGTVELGDLGTTFNLGVLAGVIDVSDLRRLWSEQTGEEAAFAAQRLRTAEELIEALESGSVDAIVVGTEEVDRLALQPSSGFRSVIVLNTEFTGRSFLFGTDQLGRDVFSRVIYGTRVALFIGLSAPAASAVVGMLLGITSAYVGGMVDRVGAGAMDALYSLPVVVVAVALAAAIGPGLFNLIVALSVVYVPTYFRLARSRALTVEQEVFVNATEALGASRLRVIGRHLLPNSVVSVGIFGTLAVAQSIRAAAILSFLGLGLASGNIVEWGSDIARARQIVLQGPWLFLGPGIALSLLIFGLTLMGDVVFENLNPRLRGSAL
jgi:peptide/nickel transport system permease protein